MATAQPAMTQPGAPDRQHQREQGEPEPDGDPDRRHAGAAGAEREQRGRRQPLRGEPGGGQARLGQEGRRAGEQVQRPGEQHEERRHRDDGRVHRARRRRATAVAASAPTANTRPSTQVSGANAAATAMSRPVAQAARRACRGAAVSIRPALTAIERQQDEGDRRAEAARRHGAGGDGQQRVRRRQQHPGRRGGDEPARGQVGGQPGERHAAEQQHVHRQPRLPAEHGGERGDDRQVRGRGRGGAHAHRVEPGQVLLPQRGGAAPGGHERAAAERAGAEQPPLGDQGDDQQRDEQLDPGVPDDPAQHGLLVDELLVFF